MPTNPDSAGFGVYVHWPFCASKCPYCDFNSHVRIGGFDEARFRAAYLAEIAETRARTGPRIVSSVFLGGGTPSLMAPATVAAIIDAIGSAWTLAADAEITLEANPSSVETGRFRGYRAAGVNRVSLGVQSLRDEALVALGRLHTAGEAKAAVNIARRTFDRFSIDLIYARQGHTLAAWRDELVQALALAGAHVSLYQLTIEAGTPFANLYASGKLKVPDPDLADALYQATAEATSAAGLPLYEISNYARPGEESRHNLLYWRYGEYAGIGPGAHGRLIVGGARRATSTERSPEGWCTRIEAAGHGRVEDAALTRAEQADECLLMGLRLAEGLDLARLADVGGVRPSHDVIARLQGQGMLMHDAARGRLSATPRGRFVLNEIVARISARCEPAGGPPSDHSPRSDRRNS